MFMILHKFCGVLSNRNIYDFSVFVGVRSDFSHYSPEPLPESARVFEIGSTRSIPTWNYTDTVLLQCCEYIEEYNYGV